MPKTSTDKPAISDSELARIRAAAHRYLLAGGAIFLAQDDTDRDEHIATIRTRLHPKAEPTFDQRLEHVLPTKTQYHEHESLSGDVWTLVSADSEAGYLFGVCVGLELAALTIRGELPRAGTTTNKDGRR